MSSRHTTYHAMNVGVCTLHANSTKVGKPVGDGGENDADGVEDKPQVDEDGRKHFSEGILKLNFEGEACTYSCDGTKSGGFCPQPEQLSIITARSGELGGWSADGFNSAFQASTVAYRKPEAAYESRSHHGMLG